MTTTLTAADRIIDALDPATEVLITYQLEVLPLERVRSWSGTAFYTPRPNGLGSRLVHNSEGIRLNLDDIAELKALRRHIEATGSTDGFRHVTRIATYDSINKQAAKIAEADSA